MSKKDTSKRSPYSPGNEGKSEQESQKRFVKSLPDDLRKRFDELTKKDKKNK